MDWKQRVAWLRKRKVHWVPVIPLVFAVAMWLYSFVSRVHGDVSASGRLAGTWTTSVNSCQSGWPDKFRGVDLLSGGRPVVRVVDTEGSGLSVQMALPNKQLTWGTRDCKLLKGTIDEQDTTFNGVSPLAGSVDFDCTADVDGSREHVAGHATFKNCFPGDTW